MKKIDHQLISKIQRESKNSSRKRAIFKFHRHQDKVQRMINVIEPNSYIRPHRHKRPDKEEVFIALQGKGVMVVYTAKGKVKGWTIISSSGPVYGCEIVPGEYHALISLSRGAAFYEVIKGPYLKKTHKEFAIWAPIDEKDGQQFNKIIKGKLKL